MTQISEDIWKKVVKFAYIKAKKKPKPKPNCLVIKYYTQSKTTNDNMAKLFTT